jgi:DNA mismatch endonuclease (patch repair protein)
MQRGFDPMTDVFDKEKRSEIMRSVKSKNTKSTELRLLNIFSKYHITGWRRTYPLYGRPDFTFPKRRIVIFVDGCFWHGHDCRNTHPKDNAEFWIKKQQRNIARDRDVTETLESKNWIVIRIWECELKKDVLPEKLIPYFGYAESDDRQEIPKVAEETQDEYDADLELKLDEADKAAALSDVRLKHDEGGNAE